MIRIVLAVVVVVLAALIGLSRPKKSNGPYVLGSVSQQWITEHRASKPANQ